MLLSQANAVPFSSLNRHWHVQGRGAPGRTSTPDALKQRLQNLAGYWEDSELSRAAETKIDV